jgi:hypothetical protein
MNPDEEHVVELKSHVMKFLKILYKEGTCVAIVARSGEQRR